MIRLSICYCLCLFIFNDVQAQQVPLFQQSSISPELANPARYGDGFLGINYRQQWSDLDKEIAPTSVRIKLDASSLLGLADKRIGLGIGLINDQAHIIKRNQVELSFAYHLIQESYQQLSAGIMVGWLRQDLSFGDTRLNDPTDLALFEGDYSQGVLDGGFGLFYQYNPIDEHSFSADVVLPQLFSSDINYEFGALMDLNPHLLARFSYRYKGANFGVEPIFVYRRIMQSNGAKKGSIDASLQFSFLEGRLMAGAGTRLSSSTTHFSAGVQPLADQALQINVIFELHSIFGNTFELGIMYPFNTSDIKKTDRQDNNTPKPQRLSRRNKKEINDITKRATIALEKGKIATEIGENSLDGLEGKNIPEIAREERLRFAQMKLREAEEQLRTILRENNQLKNLPASQSNIQTGEAISEIDLKHSELNTKIASLSTKIERIKNSFSIKALLEKGQILAIQKTLQNGLSQSPNLPLTTENVVVESDNASGIRILYRFSNTQQAYQLSSNDLSQERSLINHIISKIKQLQAEGLTIEGVNLNAHILYPQRRWKQFEGGIYNGEYGRDPFLNCNITDQDTGSTTRRLINVNLGTINLEELIVLKLLGIAKEFESRLTLPLYYSISGPDQQESGEIYEIEIRVK